MVLLYHFHYAMDKRLYFESLEELSHKDTWVHYYFEYYKTFVEELFQLQILINI
jgi:hypothetical protein